MPPAGITGLSGVTHDMVCLAKALGGGSSGTTVVAPNYYDQFSNIKLPSYNPGQQPIVGMNPGYQMTGTVLPTGPVSPKV